jgi:hypothetical protein
MCPDRVEWLIMMMMTADDTTRRRSSKCQHGTKTFGAEPKLGRRRGLMRLTPARRHPSRGGGSSIGDAGYLVAYIHAAYVSHAA